MAIIFQDRTNTWIDALVELANDRKGDHALEALFVPLLEDEGELIDDTLPEDDKEPGILDFSGHRPLQSFGLLPNVDIGQTAATEPAVIAVDAGVIDLGELATGGTVFAIRGAAVCYPPNREQPFVCRYNTGALVIDHQNKYPLFHYMGQRLGKEDLFVELLPGPPHYAPREAMAETANQIQDRCRNFVERLIQEEAISILQAYGGGILLIDGALSGGTFDTPETYLRALLAGCRDRAINVAAISKKTRITVAGRPISTLFAEQPGFVGYAPLTTILAHERQAAMQAGRPVQAISVADDVFAARFSFAPPGLTFRVDVHPTLGCLSTEVLDQVHNHCQIYGGYPRPLIEAHQHCSFLYQDVQLLLADITVRLGIRPEERPSMEVLFQPFGGKYK